jgi:hypothetical protein
MDTERVAADAPLRWLIGDLDLGDEIARRRIGPGKRDAGGFADQAAPSVASDQVLRPQPSANAELNINAGVVLRETLHLDAVGDGHCQLFDPAGEDALDVGLPQRKPIIVPGGKIADVQSYSGEPCNLRLLPLGEEPICDAALIEDLDGARVQPSGAPADQVLTGTPLDNGNSDTGQRQFTCQHQPRGTCSGDHHRVLGYGSAHLVFP